MAFQLRSQSPLLQNKKKPTVYDKVSGKVYEKVYGFEEDIDTALVTANPTLLSFK